MVNTLTKNEVFNKLNLHRLENVTMKDGLSIISVKPNALINDKRFDIMAKYIYAKFYDMNLNSSWGSRLYEEHIWVFNNYDEDDGSGKKGIASFFTSFHATLDSLKENGFDDRKSLLPIDENNVPIEGAHRITAALLYNKKVKAIKLSGKNTNYNYAFFKDKGLLSKWGDAIAYEYCKLKKETVIVVLFPKAIEGKEHVKNILKDFGAIYYEKNIELKKEGPRNLLLQLKRLKAFHLKAGDSDKIINHYFSNQYIISVFLLETSTSANLSGLNTELNRLYSGSDYSPFYISDTYKETLQLCQTFFNDNSIHFLNHSKPLNVEEAKKTINRCNEYIKKTGLDSEYFCVTDNTVLSVYGLKESTYIEYIQKEFINEDKNLFRFDNLICCNNDFRECKRSIDDIIFNPENHFYYEGIKFASLKMVKEVKKKQYNYEEIKAINHLLGKWPKNLNYKQLQYNLIKKIKITRLKIIDIKLKSRLKYVGLVKRFIKSKV